MSHSYGMQAKCSLDHIDVHALLYLFCYNILDGQHISSVDNSVQHGSDCAASCRFLGQVTSGRPGTCPTVGARTRGPLAEWTQASGPPGRTQGKGPPGERTKTKGTTEGTRARGAPEASCRRACVSDVDCSETSEHKCCSNGCSSTCQLPSHIYDGLSLY